MQMKISTNCWSLLELGMIFFPSPPAFLLSFLPPELSPKENFKYQIKRESKNIFSLVNLTRLVLVFGFGGGSGFIELVQNKPTGIRGGSAFVFAVRNRAWQQLGLKLERCCESKTPKWPWCARFSGLITSHLYLVSIFFYKSISVIFSYKVFYGSLYIR